MGHIEPERLAFIAEKIPGVVVRAGRNANLRQQFQAQELHVGICQQADIGALVHLLGAVVAADDYVKTVVDEIEARLRIENVRLLDIIGVEVAARIGGAVFILLVEGFPVAITDDAEQ